MLVPCALTQGNHWEIMASGSKANIPEELHWVIDESWVLYNDDAAEWRRVFVFSTPPAASPAKAPPATMPQRAWANSAAGPPAKSPPGVEAAAVRPELPDDADDVAATMPPRVWHWAAGSHAQSPPELESEAKAKAATHPEPPDSSADADDVAATWMARVQQELVEEQQSADSDSGSPAEWPKPGSAPEAHRPPAKAKAAAKPAPKGCPTCKRLPPDSHKDASTQVDDSVLVVDPKGEESQKILAKLRTAEAEVLRLRGVVSGCHSSVEDFGQPNLKSIDEFLVQELDAVAAEPAAQAAPAAQAKPAAQAAPAVAKAKPAAQAAPAAPPPTVTPPLDVLRCREEELPSYRRVDPNDPMPFRQAAAKHLARRRAEVAAGAVAHGVAPDRGN